FFFQAEDGIRDFHVTGVQTCALPIFHVLFGGVWLIGGFGSHVSPHSSTERVRASRFVRTRLPRFAPSGAIAGQLVTPCIRLRGRSEERRVGKACSLGGGGDR